jgi:hypothetical protein
MKTLNTQLASWTQLRHDTVLYAKQSYTEPILCAYPAGFVEPRPEFWERMELLADVTSNAIAGLRLSGLITVPGRVGPSVPPGFAPMLTVDLKTIQTRQLTFLTNFAGITGTLESIAAKERQQLPLSLSEADFLKNTIEIVYAYSNYRQWNGWYPGLFYTNAFFGYSTISQPPCDVWDPLVTDVHTDLPDPLVGDPGAVIHEAVANVNLMLIAVDNGPDRMVYAGPVLSHYEFEVPGTTRLTDADWKNQVLTGQKAPPEEWTRTYLVPGNITVPAIYQ